VKVRILGCGTSTGVPKIGNVWGQCNPAEPRNAIALADALGQHLGDLDQRMVAGLVAKRVVDHLQPVDVDEQHRGTVVVAADAVDRRFELTHESAAIRKVDQDVLMGEAVEKLHALVKLRNLSPEAPDFGQQRVRIGHVDDHVIHGNLRFPFADRYIT